MEPLTPPAPPPPPQPQELLPYPENHHYHHHHHHHHHHNQYYHQQPPQPHHLHNHNPDPHYPHDPQYPAFPEPYGHFPPDQNHQEYYHNQFNSYDNYNNNNSYSNYNDHNNYNNNINNYNNGYDQWQPYDANPNPNVEGNNDPFGAFRGSGTGGGFRFKGRKRDHNDGGSYAKLFVAPIPRTSTAEDIGPLFEEYGNIVEIIFPKRAGQQQGYCFVKYASFDEADKAIWALNGQYTMPGEVIPLKVRYADGGWERADVGRERVAEQHLGRPADKLYVGNVNRLASKKDVEDIFTPYGHVVDVYVALNDMKQIRCAFVKYSHRDMALAAIKALHGIYTMSGCDQPLMVRFVDPKKPRTGESRFNHGSGGHSTGPSFQEPMRLPMNSGDSSRGCIPQNTSFPAQDVYASSQPPAGFSSAKPESASTHGTEVAERSASPVDQSASQLSQMPLQMPLQGIQASENFSQSAQQSASKTHSQVQTLEVQQDAEVPLLSPCDGTNHQSAVGDSAASVLPSNPPAEDPDECDWSEHFCPDGYKYYYNCVTCESRWQKPEEFALFQQRMQERRKLQGLNQQSRSMSPVISPIEVKQTQKDLDHLQVQSERTPVVEPASV